MKNALQRIRTLSLGLILGAAVSIAMTPQPVAANSCEFCVATCPLDVYAYCSGKGCSEGYAACWEAYPQQECYPGYKVYCNLI